VAARWRGEEVVAKVFGETSGEAAAHAAEARLLLAAGPHPNIVRLLGATAHPPRLLLHARAGGGSLHDRLHNGQPTTGVRRWAEAFAWGRDVASALSHLHSLRPPLVHRDVKAANVLLDLPAEADGGGARAGTRAAGCTAVAEPTRTGSLGRARLCDFGSGAALPANPSDSLGVGTPGWMAPELLGADGAVHAGCACDVFSLGCLLFELASRTLPFAALGEAEMMAAAAAGRTPLDEAPLLADTPARLVTLIRECLAFDAYARPHAAVVAERLERMRAEQLVSSAGIAAAGSREREEA
jgi:serine/threonine protein kinase